MILCVYSDGPSGTRPRDTMGLAVSGGSQAGTLTLRLTSRSWLGDEAFTDIVGSNPEHDRLCPAMAVVEYVAFLPSACWTDVSCHTPFPATIMSCVIQDRAGNIRPMKKAGAMSSELIKS